MPFGIGKGDDANLPPGSMGWSLLGEALEYARSPHRFMESRVRRYGPVFKTRILGSKIICFAGPEPFTFFVDNPDLFRAGAAPGHVRELLFHRSLPLIDGADHANLRARVSQALGARHTGAYLRLVGDLLARYTERWEALGQFSWTDEYRRLAAGVCHAVVLGKNSDFNTDAELARDLDVFLDGMAAFPVNLPFTRYGRSLRRRDRLLALVDSAIRNQQEADRDCILSRMLEPGNQETETVTQEALRAQALHLLFAAYGGRHERLR